MDIVSVLTEMGGGQILAHCNSKFHELNEAVRGTLAKGKLIIEITVAPGKVTMNRGLETVELDVDVKTKIPELALGTSIFFIDDDNNLSRNDPRQEELFAERKEVKNG